MPIKISREVISSQPSQASRRRTMQFRDQHRHACSWAIDGRIWWAETEPAADGAGMPGAVGEYMPDGWQAPWLPEPAYINFSAGRHQDNKFHINYQKIITEYREANRVYYLRAVKVARDHNLPMPERPGDPVDNRLEAVCGAPPRSTLIAESALAGDPWLLGFIAEPNLRLQRLLEVGDERVASPTEVFQRDQMVQQLSQDEIAQMIEERAEAIAQKLFAKMRGAAPPKARGKKAARTRALSDRDRFMGEQMKAGVPMAEASRAWTTQNAVA